MVAIEKANSTSVLDRIYIGVLLVIFGGIVLQAPLSVGLGTLWPQYNLLIKSWAEILMGVAAVVALLLLYRKQQLKLLKTPLLLIIFAYGLLHIVLLPFFWQGTLATIAGLFIDLRYMVFFVLVYIALKLYPHWRSKFLLVAVISALVVVVFAILQVTILPVDILKYLGYNANTIQPYLTVDLNSAFVRINSTLRGPNPLGAYAVIVLSLVVAAVAKRQLSSNRKTQIAAAVLAVGGLVALWASYSRSAWLAAIVAILIIGLVAYHRTAKRAVWITGIATVCIVVGVVLASRGSNVLSDILLHDNPVGGSAIKSDQGHISSLANASQLVLQHPLGGGVGSTGSASLLGNHLLIIENQYLFTAHEVGWLGLILFAVINGWILVKLWRKRSDFVTLGVFASGIGMVVIGILLPVWVDDTVSIIWWGLAATALATQKGKS